MDKEYLLNTIGLSEKEAKAYIAILELGQSTIKPISARSGIKRTSIYNFIDHLVELGLVTQSIIRGRTHYKAQSPTKLVEIQKGRIRLLEKALPEFLSLFNNNVSKPKISYYEGPDQMRTMGREVLNCKEEVCYLWPGPELTDITGGEKYWNEISKERIENGIFVRLLRFHGNDPLWDLSKSGLEYLREIRWSPKNLQNTVDMGVAIYDTGKVALFGSREESFGILIESESYRRTMKMLFELLWEKSTPAKPGEG